MPGLDSTGMLFEPFVAALGDACRVHVIAYPAQRPMSYPELEAFALSRLPREGSLVLLGESFSGPIAVSLAAALPERVRGVILCCSFVSNPRPTLAGLASLAVQLPVQALPMRALGLALYGRGSSLERVAALRRALSIVSPSVLRSRLMSVLSVDQSASLAAVKAPLLYLRASRDRLVPAAACARVRQLQPAVRIHAYDAAHGLLQTRPHETAVDVAAFVREVDGQAARS
jgi:pimeloyl-[acyl-carrier protein] methyl ester esterase